MRLRKIQLSGFKSFVDPTTIELPGDIIAVVGPNGCGKSNVIDAVRWVMGESSAKHLRGDLMADVIFNGSSTRKPVGQASVELLFDNSEGRLGERFAAFAEISVRRQVNRDGQSIYTLNGTRCRRRDITDVFLGTGLGPRSYGIIEQGTISRLVEARPEELREFLEEAAGISRYKERRRETDNRMRHTEENLERLDDVREELHTQIDRLRRQAAQAERFKSLKSEERRLRSEVLALRWRGLDAEASTQARAVAEQQNRLESALAEQRRIEADLERQRSDQSAASDAFNETYRQVLEAGADVGRSEESLQSLRSRRESLLASVEQERGALARAEEQAADDARRLEALRSSLQSAEPELQRHEDEIADSSHDLQRAERGMREFETGWEQFGQREAEPSRVAHGEHARIQQLDAQSASLAARGERLRAELGALECSGLAERVDTLGRELDSVGAVRQRTEQMLVAVQTRIQDLREREAADAERLDAARQTAHELAGRRASLEALQQAALREGSVEAGAWLQANGLASAPRLAEVLRVERGWEAAVETALGAHLQAVVVEDFEAYLRALDGLGAGSVAFAAPLVEIDATHAPAGRRLLDTVESGAELVADRLRGIHAAERSADAHALGDRLAPGESVLSADGVWIGRGWARVVRADEESGGVLAREQTLRDVGAALDVATASAEALATRLTATRVGLAEAEDGRAELDRELAAVQERHASVRSALAGVQAEIEQQTRRARDVASELVALGMEQETAERQLTESRARLAKAEEEARRAAEERTVLLERRALLERARDAARARSQALRQDAYETGLRVESARSQIAALEEGRERLVAQVAALTARAEELAAQRAGLDKPIAQAEARRQAQLRRHGELDEALTLARAAVEAGDGRVRELEQARGGAASAVETEREELGRLRVAAQETLVRGATVREQLEESGHEVESVLAEIEDGAEEGSRAEGLDQAERKIARLGPINLAAIDEFEQQSERKQYLDAQHADLTEALATLDEAIRKIDRETRARFKETYERVNTGLEKKFPRLFGGGSAYLQLTSDDLLETGVSVMARPPGKRNTSIHLLSGGEKALTAVALVFAIFDLNPAPFCLLDEVDAPLDDANVGRFSELVREMSEQLQVVLVTHNKVTMEAAQQLIGVTMNEPGVSRLVAVDIDAAVDLAAD